MLFCPRAIQESGVMKELIEIFRMTEISPSIRANLLFKMGELINYQFASNVTEPVIFELVSILDPKHPMLSDERFRRLAGVKP